MPTDLVGFLIKYTVHQHPIYSLMENFEEWDWWFDLQLGMSIQHSWEAGALIVPAAIARLVVHWHSKKEEFKDTRWKKEDNMQDQKLEEEGGWRTSVEPSRMVKLCNPQLLSLGSRFLWNTPRLVQFDLTIFLPLTDVCTRDYITKRKHQITIHPRKPSRSHLLHQ